MFQSYKRLKSKELDSNKCMELDYVSQEKIKRYVCFELKKVVAFVSVMNSAYVTMN